MKQKEKDVSSKASRLKLGTVGLISFATLSGMSLFIGSAHADDSTANGDVTLTVSGGPLTNGGTLEISGTAPAGKAVFIEVWASDERVKTTKSELPTKDNKLKATTITKTSEMPAFYTILTPSEISSKIEEAKAQGKKWKYSELLEKSGAKVAYNVPAKIQIDQYSKSFADFFGTGTKLKALDEAGNRKQSMTLVKEQFGTPTKLLRPIVTHSTGRDGMSGKEMELFQAKLQLPKDIAPGMYKVRAYVDSTTKSEVFGFENTVTLPHYYSTYAGTSINLIYPFVIALAVSIFGVLMGAGGGFILNPVLMMLFPSISPGVVAGTVMPTVLFSQSSGIYNYTKIKFINWKLGVCLGIPMLLGGFIGPRLNELIPPANYKLGFGIILFILALIMVWQTTPKQLEKAKKEKAIIDEFKRQATENI